MALLAAQPVSIPNDDLSSIPDVNDDLDDLFRPMQASIDLDPAPEATIQPRSTQILSSSKRSRAEDDDLGLNEEIQISKKRKPVAKLDDERLLSQAGIPKLRRLARERLKFKGKGHEFSDISRMLNLYQLWLDDLYPRAKFADGLVMIEKLGHSKRMNVMRKEWVREDENQTRLQTQTRDDAEPDKDNEQERETPGNGEQRRAEEEEESLFVGGDGEGAMDEQPDSGGQDQPGDDELDALLAEVDDIEETAEPGRPSEKSISPDRLAPKETNASFEDQYAEEMRMMVEMESW